jgi:hypothetical protein
MELCAGEWLVMVGGASGTERQRTNERGSHKFWQVTGFHLLFYLVSYIDREMTRMQKLKQTQVDSYLVAKNKASVGKFVKGVFQSADNPKSRASNQFLLRRVATAPAY